MTKKRIESAIEVIKYAIKNQISLKKASELCGYAGTYVKNIKAVVFDKYENNSIDDELFNLFNKAYLEYVNNSQKDISRSEKKINEKTTIRSKDQNTTEIEWNGGINYPKDHVKTLDDLLKVCEVNTDIWKVKDYVVNKWDVTTTKTKTPQTFQNFQVKARLEKDIKLQKAVDLAEIFIKQIKNYTPPKFKIELTPENHSENNLLEVSIFDLHVGKLAWAGETGEDYNLDIAKERFFYAIKSLLKYASGFKYNRILFPIGNDFFNSDNIFNSTTKGTPQDEDARWQKTYEVGCELLVDGINILKQSKVPVDVLMIPGNHDFSRNFMSGHFLSAWFKDDNQVTINNSASPRKYYKFGKVLLGFTHGSEEKESSLPMIMANDPDSKSLWSETIFHEFHLGHIHRKRNVRYEVDVNRLQSLTEDHGVTVRYLSSLTGNEEWHHKKGYVGQVKGADGFIWNDELGLTAHLNSNYIN